MGQKISHRQVRKPRNLVVKDMILNTSGGPMRDRRERRPKEKEDVRKLMSEDEDEDFEPRPYHCEW